MEENYERNSKTKEYTKKFNKIFNQNRGDFEFILQFLHDVIESGEFTGSKALDIGNGAMVHNIASASSQFSNIVQSDYDTDNVEELRRWHTGQSTLDWSQFLDLVAAIEKNSGYSSSTKEALECRIRNTVSCIVHGDLLCDTVLPQSEMRYDAAPPFDLITSVLCIETVALNYESYVDILKRLNGLLTQGGGLLLCGYGNGSPWTLGEQAFNHVKLGVGQISDALKAAGFRILEMRIKKKMKSGCVCDSLFCISAAKFSKEQLPIRQSN